MSSEKVRSVAAELIGLPAFRVLSRSLKLNPKWVATQLHMAASILCRETEGVDSREFKSILSAYGGLLEQQRVWNEEYCVYQIKLAKGLVAAFADIENEADESAVVAEESAPVATEALDLPESVKGLLIEAGLVDSDKIEDKIEAKSLGKEISGIGPSTVTKIQEAIAKAKASE